MLVNWGSGLVFHLDEDDLSELEDGGQLEAVVDGHSHRPLARLMVSEDGWRVNSFSGPEYGCRRLCDVYVPQEGVRRLAEDGRVSSPESAGNCFREARVIYEGE